MIEIRGLAKRFGEITVLRALDLRIARGRITAIVGPNAAGKTTLIKTIVGLTRPGAGDVIVNGTVVNGDERYRRDIGYMPQIARFPENMCAAELLALLRKLRRDARSAERTDDDLVHRFGIEQFMRAPLRTLSGGSRQKVNAVLAFLFKPALLILDEPTAGLDALASSILKDKILEARLQECTVVITSHVMSELEELADDVALLVDGELRYAGPLGDLKTQTRQATLERAVAKFFTSKPKAVAA